ncbi:MAG: cell division protein FtsL [Terriglobia bacterium]
MGPPVQVYWVKRIDNSRLVRQRDPGYLRTTAALVGGAGVCLAVILLCAWQHFQFIHSGYSLEELRQRHAQVLEWNRTLRLEQAALLDPMRIDLLARTRLGLDAAGANQVIPVGSVAAAAGVPVLAWAPLPAEAAAGNPRPPARSARISIAH